MRSLFLLATSILIVACSGENENRYAKILKSVESEWETVSQQIVNLEHNIQQEKRDYIGILDTYGMAVPQEIRSKLSEEEMTKLDSLYHELSSYSRVFNRISNQATVMRSSWSDKFVILTEVKQEVEQDKVVNQTEDRILKLQESLNKNTEKISRLSEILKNAKTGYSSITDQLQVALNELE